MKKRQASRRTWWVFAGAIVLVGTMVPSRSGAGTVTFQDLWIIDKDQGNRVVVGAADAFIPVDFEAHARCSCGCGSLIEYAWDFADGTSGTGSHPKHYYGQQGAGVRWVSVGARCQSCGATGWEGFLTVYVISDVIIDGVGMYDNLQAMCFTYPSGGDAHVFPEDLPSECDNLIDWSVQIGEGPYADAQVANNGHPQEITVRRWPYSNPLWGAGSAGASIDGDQVPLQEDELVTGQCSLIGGAIDVEKFFGKTESHFPEAGDPANWFWYWASGNRGPCLYRVHTWTYAYGAFIRWHHDPWALFEGKAERVDSLNYRIALSNYAAGASNINWNSPRYPAEGDFLDSEGNPRHFDPGNLSFHFVREEWEGVDHVEATARHEMSHVKVWRRWEPGGAWWILYGEWSGLNENDWDGDLLPNSVEDSLGTYWKFIATYNALNPDFPGGDEFYLSGEDDEVFAEVQSSKPSWPCFGADQDWACPGKRWHELYPGGP